MSYPAEVDQEILAWLLKMTDLDLPTSSLALREFAKSIKFSLTTKNLKQALTGFKNVINVTDLHNQTHLSYLKAPQTFGRGILWLLRDVCKVFKDRELSSSTRG